MSSPKMFDVTRDRETSMSAPSIRVAYSQIPDSIDPTTWNNLFNELPQNAKYSLSRYHIPADQQRFLTGRMLLKYLLINYFSQDSCVLERLQFSQTGRPSIDAQVDFNISHSGEFAVVAASNDCNLGLDIEMIKALPLSEMTDVLSEQQYQQIKHSADPHLIYRFWTAKESIVKLTGEGLNAEMNEIELDFKVGRHGNQIFYLWEIDIHPAYVCFLSASRQVSFTVERIDFAQLDPMNKLA